MKNFPLFFTLFLALLLTACNKEDNLSETLQATQKVDQATLLAALLAPEVAANAGKRVNGNLQIQFKSKSLDEDLKQAIKDGALEELDQITLTAEQVKLIFNTTDLSSVPNTENVIAKDRWCGEICYEKEICILNTGNCYFIEHCIDFCH